MKIVALIAFMVLLNGGTYLLSEETRKIGNSALEDAERAYDDAERLYEQRCGERPPLVRWKEMAAWKL